ncbi:MAG: hypothetical protein ACFFDN_02155 [Candidatus Hodarchaeota archaeon]
MGLKTKKNFGILLIALSLPLATITTLFLMDSSTNYDALFYLLNLDSKSESFKINSIVRVRDSSANFTYSIGFISGNIILNGSEVIGKNISAIDCVNVTSMNRYWNRIVIFNNVQLRILSIDRDLVIYAYNSSSIIIPSSILTHSLQIYNKHSSYIEINGLNDTNPSIFSTINLADFASGKINGSYLDHISVTGSSSISISLSNISDAMSYDKSNLTFIQCNITSKLYNGIYVTSGILTVNTGSIIGSYVNTTTIIDSIINAKLLIICAYESAIVQLQSYGEELPMLFRENSELLASGPINGGMVIYGWDYANISISDVNNNNIEVNCFGYSKLFINNSTLLECDCTDFVKGTIQNSTISTVRSYRYSKVIINSESTVSFGDAKDFSSMTINSSTVGNLLYGIYYISGSIIINDGVLPIGYGNCCTVVNSTTPIVELRQISFNGSTSALISGNTPDWAFIAFDNVTMNLQSVIMISAFFDYRDESHGEIKDSDIYFIFSYLQTKFSLTVDNSTVHRIDVYSVDYIMLIKNDSNIYESNIHFLG